jgi:glycine/D-amino acid oxidase-like deaminating enzyme
MSHVVVVGAGVLGCSIAYQLAKSGARTALVERDRIGEHASGRNPGNLNPILATAPELVPLALASFRLHGSLAQELATLGCASYGTAPVRRVLVAFDEQERVELDATARQFAEHAGFATTRLTPAQLQTIEPRLSAAIREGLVIEGNLSLDSHAFNLALAEGARRAGATPVHATVQGLLHRDGRVEAVRTEAGELACDALVLATGPWVAETRAWLGIELAVEPVKGEMLRMRLPGANITHDFTHGIISLYRRGDDELWVGVTRERRGFDAEPSAAGREALVDAGARIMPAIRDAAILAHLAALRPMTPMGLPVVGRAPGWDNVFVANGGGGKGMLLCTGIGVAIRDLVLTGETAMPVSALAFRGAR